jgi:p-aminobenzoyl-glutamate transporter AbgT
MRFVPALLKIRIKPIQNRWVTGVILASVIAVYVWGFSDFCATIAHRVYGRPLHPAAFWVAIGFVLVLSVWFIYIQIYEWRFGPRRKRREKDKHDA